MIKKFKPQFDKYKNSLENIIFTNMRAWQLYQWDGESKSKKVKEVIFDFLNPDVSELKNILDLFVAFQIRGATSSRELAINLAKKTQLLSNILELLLYDGNSQLNETKEEFKKSILHDIENHSFANLLAETFSYSLFIATLRHFESGKVDELSLTTAFDYIPKNIPVLYDLYNFARNLSRDFIEVERVVQLILKELNFCDIEKIRGSFYKTDDNDPILYFYEPFLNAYDPATKKERGAFYTPKSVVDFITRETHKILQNDFNLEGGFLAKSVKVLDPATGTGTFLFSLIELVKREIYENFGGLGLEREKFLDEVSEHILKNFFGFELMVAPYTIAHLKLSILLQSFDRKLEDNERFQIYLANSLDDPSREPNNLFGFSNLTKEGKRAKEIKNQSDIIAIIGNPPYSGTSQNPSRVGKELTWIGDQIEKYKWNGKRKLDEKNPKWLQDDYVKFIRFAQFQIDKNDRGVISYIVPHGFLDNPTFRYMRKSLLDSFHKIYILNLHGNSKKKEKTPDGEKDENVFDIQQGVTLLFLVKTSSKKDQKIFYGDLWGVRKEKFQSLENGNLEKICKTELFPKNDMFYFIPRDTTLETEYLAFWSLKDIFEINSVGIVTGGDKRFIKDEISDFEKDFSEKEKFKEIDYRPFDKKHIYYDTKLIERAREKVMKHMLKENIGLVSNRQVNGDFYHSFITNKIMESSFVSNKTREISYIFPLYKYSDSSSSLFETKSPNFTNEFLEFRKKELLQWSDEEIFYYIYGSLFSPNYREKYREFLQTDFPRIDFNRDISKISKIGRELAELHLLKHKIFSTPKNWQIKKVGTDLELNLPKKAEIFLDDKIYFNSSTYLSGISDEVWNFHIGGYQVLYKWLADRNGKTLTIDELTHYIKIVVSLQETLKLMKKL